MSTDQPITSLTPRLPKTLAYAILGPGITLLVVSVVGCLIASSWLIERAIREQANADMEDSVSELSSHLGTIEDLSQARLQTALNLLRDQVPADFTHHSQPELQQLVNRIQLMTGARATIFGRKDADFVRLATTIPDRDGEYAIGTNLEKSSAAYGPLSTSQSFHGAVVILHQAYITTYEPVADKRDGSIRGAIFVGFPLVSLPSIADAVGRPRILEHGFVALLDDQYQVVGRTESASDREVRELTRNGCRQGWVCQVRPFVPWHYRIVAAFPESDVDALVRKANLAICGIGFLLALALGASQFYVFDRRVRRPLEETRLRALEISQGNLEHVPLTIADEHELGNLRAAINVMERALRERQRIEKDLELAHLAAKHDHLTHVLNRAGLDEVLHREFARFMRSLEVFAVLVIDLDHFKAVNDTHGHLVGDQVLQATVKKIQVVLRATDVIGRFGGEEFLVIAPRCDRPGAIELGERIRATIAGAPIVHGVSITVSVGAATSDEEPNDVSALISRADSALYRAKQMGRNRLELAPAHACENSR
ncbi:MAG TPA: diguanylate cyclase [Terriglobales bacterium]